jgi:hypothetical protein
MSASDLRKTIAHLHADHPDDEEVRVSSSSKRIQHSTQLTAFDIYFRGADRRSRRPRCRLARQAGIWRAAVNRNAIQQSVADHWKLVI